MTTEVEGGFTTLSLISTCRSEYLGGLLIMESEGVE